MPYPGDSGATSKKNVSDVRRRADPDITSMPPKRGIQPHKNHNIHLHGAEKMKIKQKKWINAA